MRFRLGMAVGFAAGYYLGTQAGRERYEEINRMVRKIKRSDAFDTATDKVLRTVKLTGLPNQCAVTPDGKFVGVPIRGADRVDLVDVARGQVVKSLPVKGRFENTDCDCGNPF